MDFFSFPIYLLLPATLWPWVLSASTKNEYQETSLGTKQVPAHKADNLTATNCYRDSFTSYLFMHYWELTFAVKKS
jgi:hypothetical protein